MTGLARFVTGRRSRWVVLAVWVVLVAVAAPLSMRLQDITKDTTRDYIPPGSQASQVSDILDERFEGGDRSPVVVVYRRTGGLTAADQQAILEHADEASGVDLVDPGLVPFGRDARPGLVSEDGEVALSILNQAVADQREVRDSIEALREIVHAGPAGLDAFVTGNNPLDADHAEEREAADRTLLTVTAVLVLTLLIAIYRSPIVALAPLITVGVAYTVANGILYLLAEAGMTVTGTSLSLLLVLMFGAAADYCLLLVARYVEDLRRTEHETDAMMVSLPRAGPAIIASGATVIAALLTLSLASVSLISSLGPVNAVGLAVGLAASLTLLPAMITLMGRRGFWPSAGSVAYRSREAPKLLPGLRPLALEKTPVTDQHPTVREREGIWRRVGVRVLATPSVALVLVLGLLGAGALGLTQFDTEANTRADILADTDATRGFDVLSERFPPGASAPATVLVMSDDGPVSAGAVEEAQTAVAETPGIANVSPPTGEASDGSAVTFTAVLEEDPLSSRGVDRVEDMREAIASLEGGAQGLVGGPPGIALDLRDGISADLKLAVPLVLGTIFLILILLLRAVVAPLYLIASTFASFFGILGASVVLVDLLFGIDPLNAFFPILAFIFLVALGVDYNIFLIDRVREEAAEHGTREGALRALVATGPVITSAGLILAGTFAALITVPIGGLKSLGFTVALGVLIDTFIVRTLLVPAILELVGDASWWPSKLGRGRARVAPGGSGISPLQSGVFEVVPAPPPRSTPRG